MNKYPNHGYIILYLLDCGVHKSLMSEQNYADPMTKHRPNGICSVDYIMSSKSPSATIT
jgi:hypothetical protein